MKKNIKISLVSALLKGSIVSLPVIMMNSTHYPNNKDILNFCSDKDKIILSL